jgi:hypothetical protein
VDTEPTAKAGDGRLAPIERLDAAWQKVEAYLCASVLVVEIVALALWVTLRGLSTQSPGEGVGGLVCRSFLSAAALAAAGHFAARRRGLRIHRAAMVGGIVLGLVAGRFWVHEGVTWASNLLNYFQNASVLMLIGGLRGAANRLTLWVALLGASLATSRGRHIHVDVLMRYIPGKLRLPSAVLGWLTAATVCAAAAAGFVDYIAVAEFRIEATGSCGGESAAVCDTGVGTRLEAMRRKIARDIFVLGRQASLDVRSLPRVVVGIPYDSWMTATDWNAWIDGADWAAHFDKDAVDTLHADPAGPARTPQVVVPENGEDARGLLTRDANLVFPFGLLVIGIKFLLRALLVLSRGAPLERSEIDAPRPDEAVRSATSEVAA